MERVRERARWLLAAGDASCLVSRSGKPRTESETPAPCVEGDFGTCDLDVTAREAGNRGAASKISSLTSSGLLVTACQAGTHEAWPLRQVTSLLLSSNFALFLPQLPQTLPCPGSSEGSLPPPLSSATSASPPVSLCSFSHSLAPTLSDLAGSLLRGGHPNACTKGDGIFSASCYSPQMWLSWFHSCLWLTQIPSSIIPFEEPLDTHHD